MRFETHNLDTYPRETEQTKFKVKTPIVADPTTIVPIPVVPQVPESVDVVTVSEDSDSDDEGTETLKVMSEPIPAENHILCEPAEPQKAVTSTSKNKDAPIATEVRIFYTHLRDLKKFTRTVNFWNEMSKMTWLIKFFKNQTCFTQKREKCIKTW